jgi:hypothetical protein
MIPMVEDFSLHGEYVHQRNGEDRRKVRAHAFDLEPGHQFSSVAWQPS